MTMNILAAYRNLSDTKRGWIRLAIKLLIAFLFFYFCFGVFAGISRVSGISMDGRIKDGDYILFDRVSNNFMTGDVILFEKDGKTHISEIIATSNDVITIDKDGFIYVNDNKYREDSIYSSTASETEEREELVFRVSQDQYYVLNENLNDDSDSRTLGGIEAKEIKGKVISILLRTLNI